MTHEDICRLLRESPLAHLAGRIEELVLPSIRIHAATVEQEELAIGASRFGGIPDVPEGFAWPTCSNGPMALLAQIRMADLGRWPEAAEVSAMGGWLLVFYDMGEQVWGFDPKDRAFWEVVHVDCPLDDLHRLPPPPLDEDSQFPPCALRFEIEYQLPPSDVVEGTLELEFSKEEWDAYDDLLTQVGGEEDATTHRMFGHADEIQGDMQLECQLVSNGLYCGDAKAYQDPRVKELAETAWQWMLLLQIDTDEEGPGWMWGDCGRLYFWIREADLEAKRFDKCWMVSQCY